MSQQPIPKKVIDSNNLPEEKSKYTLLVDGNSLLELSWHGDPRLNSRGVHIGGVFQFLLQLKILMAKRDFDYVYVFWDGDNSGELRFNLYPEYKANRDKNFNTDSVSSDYYKQMDVFMKHVLKHSAKNKEKNQAKLSEKEDFHRQRRILQEYLEELFIRQVMCDKIEGDDLIGYYCLNKKDNDKIYIVSGDMDISQLIDDYICLYIPRLKKFITPKNHTEEIGYYYKNTLLKKMICGDSSDNIKGVKGVAESTLFKIMPEIKTKEVKLWDVIDRCKTLSEERTKDKKKPLAAYENIINGITTGMQGDKLYEINKKIIDLKHPLLSHDAIEMMDDIMYVPIDGDGRSMGNLYKMIIRDDITELIDNNRFSTFFSTFNKSIEKEKKFYEKWKKDNGHQR
jgi:5'-3' exonuclease